MRTQEYDTVISNGRVIDPETHLDAVRNIGIQGNIIAALSEKQLIGKNSINAANLVVAPGYIDLYTYNQSISSDRIQAYDGVTTALNLQSGVVQIDTWYNMQAHNGRALNYGTAVSCFQTHYKEPNIRSEELDLNPSYFCTDIQKNEFRTKFVKSNHVDQMTNEVAKGLQEGAIAIAIYVDFTSEIIDRELISIAALAEKSSVPVFASIVKNTISKPERSPESLIHFIGVAAATGARIHLCNMNSSNMDSVEQVIKILKKTQEYGLEVTIDVYPDSDAPEQQNHWEQLILLPESAIASNTISSETPKQYFQPNNEWHAQEDILARSSSTGTYAWFVTQYVKKYKKLSLVEAIKKFTLIPAQILEKSVNLMKHKGRLQVGADADIIVFDLNKVTSRATAKKPYNLSRGMRHVFVNGVQLINNGELDLMALPGRPVRRSKFLAINKRSMMFS